MSFPIPQLDDLEFEQLTEQARALIPRYAPEWTDHNLHDPGITLLDLLSWIVDQQIYQVGLVSDRHLQAFAALLGVHQQAAQPAHGLIWPNKRAGTANQHVVLSGSDLERGNSIKAIQQPDLAFVLDADVHLSAAQPVQSQAQQLNSGQVIDLTGFFQQASASFEFSTDGANDGALNAGVQDRSDVLELRFDRPLVSVGSYPVALGIEIDPVHSAQVNAATPWGPLFVEYQTDNTAWQPVTVVEDRTFALARTGVVLLNIPANNTAQQSALRLRFDRGFYPLPLRIVKVEINVLPIVQLELRPQQVIGTGNGLPDQTVSLTLDALPEQTISNHPNQAVFPKAFEIQVADKGQFVSWRQTDDLSLNLPADRVYQLDASQDQIIFGNGINGAIPEPDAQILYNEHHTTNGVQGNLGAGFEWRVANAAVQGSVFGTNLQRLFGGEDAWNLDQLMAQTRQRVLERQVMLSNQDLLNSVQSLEGFAVARSDTLLRYHPALPELSLSGTRTVVVSPWREQANGSEQAVSQRYLQAVAAAIEPYRLLGERLTVISHQVVPIRLSTTLLIAPQHDAETIKAKALQQLKSRFTVIAVAGSGQQPWPLGRPVTQGEIKALLAALPNVVAVPICLLARNESALSDQDDIKLMRDEVAVVSDGDIEIIIEILDDARRGL